MLDIDGVLTETAGSTSGWISMLDANRLERTTSWSPTVKWHLGLSATSVFGALIAATVLLSPLGTPVNELASAFFFLVVSGATTLMVVFDFSARSQRARSAAEEMNSVEVELRRLLGMEGRVDIANRRLANRRRTQQTINVRRSSG